MKLRISKADRWGDGWRAGILACAVLAIPASASAVPMLIDIEILGTEEEEPSAFTGTTADGTVFVAAPNPTEPSTGTGVFEPFVRIGGTRDSWCGDSLVSTCDSPTEQQLGMNTDTTPDDTNFDTKGGSDWTTSITLGDVGIVQIGDTTYYEFALDANEEGSPHSEKNQIELTDVQIYLGSDSLFANPELYSGPDSVDATGYTGTPFDSTDNFLFDDVAPVWTLDGVVDGVEYDVTVLLQASICGSKGQCGSGFGDMFMYIPTANIEGSPDDYLVFYTEYDKASNPKGGYEEWAVRATEVIPEPSAAMVFSLGMLVTGARLRRR